MTAINPPVVAPHGNLSGRAMLDDAYQAWLDDPVTHGNANRLVENLSYGVKQMGIPPLPSPDYVFGMFADVMQRVFEHGHYLSARNIDGLITILDMSDHLQKYLRLEEDNYHRVACLIVDQFRRPTKMQMMFWQQMCVFVRKFTGQDFQVSSDKPLAELCVHLFGPTWTTLCVEDIDSRFEDRFAMIVEQKPTLVFRGDVAQASNHPGGPLPTEIDLS